MLRVVVNRLKTKVEELLAEDQSWVLDQLVSWCFKPSQPPGMTSVDQAGAHKNRSSIVES